MIGLYLLIPTFFAILPSFLIVRAGAIALMMTGMGQQCDRVFTSATRKTGINGGY
jgi:hypothetical protein